jgi:hypothetical protein
MSTLDIVFMILGAAATLLFIAGYIRGTRTALASYDDPKIEVDDSGDIHTYWWPIVVAVLAAATIIGLVGVSPIFIYAGPLLAIGTAAVNGLAFFLEKDPKTAG